MSIQASTILSGPAKIAVASSDFFADGIITIELIIEREDRGNDAFGILKRPIGNKMIRTTFTPTEWNDLSVLYPHGATALGASIMTESDFVVTPRNGDALTLPNWGIESMPGILLSSTGSQFSSDVTFLHLLKDDEETNALASYLALAGSVGSGTSLTGMDKTKLLNSYYTGSRNSVTYHSGEGFSFDFAQDNQEIRVDGLGVVDVRLTGLVASCSFKPLGLSEAAYIALFGMATAIGKEPTRYDLTVEGDTTGDPSIVLDNTEAQPGSFVYGKEETRNGEITFATARDENSGDIVELFSVGTVSA
jgi:hypothetical protein